MNRTNGMRKHKLHVDATHRLEEGDCILFIGDVLSISIGTQYCVLVNVNSMVFPVKEKFAALKEQLECNNEAVELHEKAQKAIADPEDFLDDISTLEQLVEEQKSLVSDVDKSTPDIQQTCGAANEFLEANTDR